MVRRPLPLLLLILLTLASLTACATPAPDAAFSPAWICPPQMVCQVDPARATVSKAYLRIIQAQLEACAAVSSPPPK